MSWAQVRGHDRVRAQFETAIRRQRLGHTYLFVGPSGIGKRRFARELAKALLCEAPKEFDACDRCSSCHLVDASTHPDLLETRKPEDKMEMPIDTIRDFCDQLHLKPTRGTRKIAIVDDAESFNEESGNAFLKSLEEPPPGTILMLIGESAESQLPTIRSRCQIIPFLPLNNRDLAAVLADQGIAERDIVDKLIALAGGSPGRALALNDPEILAYRNDLWAKLSEAKPHGPGLIERSLRFIDDAGKEAPQQRARGRVIVRMVVDYLRRCLHATLPGSSPPPADSAMLANFAGRAGSDGLVAMLDAAATADNRIDERVPVALVVESLMDRLTRPPLPGAV